MISNNNNSLCIIIWSNCNSDLWVVSTYAVDKWATECPLGSKAWGWKAPVSYSQLQVHQDTPASVQIQAEWGFEQPALVEGVPGHGRGLELGDL